MSNSNAIKPIAWWTVFGLVVVSLLCPCSTIGQTPTAANYPLQVIIPRSAGTSLDDGAPAISPNHRIFWAYPGAPYNIRGAVIGGVYPYSCSLANAPEGMTVDPVTGEINWPNPQAHATNIAFTVTDGAGTRVSTAWSIAVDPAKFIFLNASSPDGGDGSRASPYNRISNIPASRHAGKIAYFMTGTYHVMDMPIAGSGGWERVEFSGSTKPISWLEYPGQSAVIEFGWKGSGTVPLIRLFNGPVYLDGFETSHSHLMAFQLGIANYAVVRRMTMHHQGPGIDGSNAAFVMFLANYGSPAPGVVIQDNTFSDIIYGTGNCALKMYSLNKSLIEDNVFHSTDAGGEAIIAIKSDNPRFTVRRNTFYDIRTPAIGGNMHRINHATSGEILYNNVRAGASEAVFLNQDSQALQVDVYRNTFLGRVRIRNVDADDGPFNLYNNVIVSSDQAGRWIPGSRIHFESVTSASRVVTANNLEGSPSQNLTDSNGDLTAGFSSYLGTHGWQLRPPLRLESPKIRPNGSFQFRLINAPARSYVIRASTNLIDWLPLATNQFSYDRPEWEDTEAGRHAMRFYRVHFGP